MPIFRKRPVEVEAMRLNEQNFFQVRTWCNGSSIDVGVGFGEPPNDFPSDLAKVLIIPTLEGNMQANIGDYIIKGVNGEFYPCKAGIFNKTYELVRP